MHTYSTTQLPNDTGLTKIIITVSIKNYIKIENTQVTTNEFERSDCN